MKQEHFNQPPENRRLMVFQNVCPLDQLLHVTVQLLCRGSAIISSKDPNPNLCVLGDVLTEFYIYSPFSRFCLDVGLDSAQRCDPLVQMLKRRIYLLELFHPPIFSQPSHYLWNRKKLFQVCEFLGGQPTLLIPNPLLLFMNIELAIFPADFVLYPVPLKVLLQQNISEQLAIKDLRKLENEV